LKKGKIGSCCCEKHENSKSNNNFTRGAMSYLFRRKHGFLQNFWLQEKKKTNSFICCMFMQKKRCNSREESGLKYVKKPMMREHKSFKQRAKQRKNRKEKDYSREGRS